MCDEELNAAILEELGYLDERKNGDNKEEDHEEGSKDNSKNTGEE